MLSETRAPGGPEPYPHVLAPIRIGALTLRNRIFVPAHTTNFGEDHLPSERHLEYHRARARGGVGAIIFESIRVQQNCVGRPQAVAGFDRRCIPAFARIGEAVRAEGARLLGQIIHLGRQVDGDFERTVSWGPSPIRWSATSAMPHAMTEDDMASVVEAHVATARNLIEAGLDGIEVQVAHGHLLQQFLSPVSNGREDAYGGPLENRMRFPLAVLRAVREAVGPDYTLGIRISAEEYLEDGLHPDEMAEVASRFAGAVKLDFVNVSHSAYHASYSLATQMADMSFDPAMFRHLPAGIRGALRQAGHEVPVFTVCRYRTLAEAEETIAAGAADMVGMARAHIAEPAIVRKTVEGRTDEIRACIACNQGCAGMLEKNMAVRCLVNPEAGLEGAWREPSTDPAPEPKNVVVIGGGPAGLEMAWVAAARGHRVRLVERADRLGGQLNHLRAMPSRHAFFDLLAFQERQLARFGVAVELGREARADEIVASRPDLVVLATGSRPLAPALPGGGPVFTVEAALADPDALGETVAFADLTGEWASLSAIAHLAGLGKRVTVFSPVAGFAWRTTIYSTLAWTKRLREKRVRIATLRKVLSFDGATLAVEDVSCGEIEALRGFSSVILARYNAASDELRAPLAQAGIPLKLVGDCLAPRTAMEAVYEGHEAGRAI
ncbi:FAD-dependent oxidoreductase [Enterovirga aerilata]|uniref:NAD-binding protein n=1 Tax=Enterovirga aerilata TaxID=2730920 RepID=A0A849I2K6_9HYPH|nr:FAD-dependent oxidoreductase [Enterovirga sp. DB1703]NNM71588.1 NAD-binding protein [Enterovirga sp. DB1703]